MLEGLKVRRIGIYVAVVLGSTLLSACATERKTTGVMPVVATQGPEDAATRARQETVTVGRLNMRMLPEANSKIVGTLREKERVEVKGRYRSWVKVAKEDGTLGWVYAPGTLTGFPGTPRSKDLPSQKGAEGHEGGSSLSLKRVGKHAAESVGDVGEKPSDGPGGSSRKMHEASTAGPDGSQTSTKAQVGLAGDGEVAAEKKVSPEKEVVFLEVVPSETLLMGRAHPPRVGKAGDGERGSAGKEDPLSAAEASSKEDHSVSAGQEWTGKLKAVIVGTKGSGRMIEIKSAPVSTAGNIWEVRPGTRLIVLGKEGRWYRVESVGGKGYLHEDFVREVVE